MDDKRLWRQIKREVKKQGNRERRHFYKKQLSSEPDLAHFDDFDYNRYNSSKEYNRKRK